jgi:hypothetical protein
MRALSALFVVVPSVVLSVVAISACGSSDSKKNAALTDDGTTSKGGAPSSGGSTAQSGNAGTGVAGKGGAAGTAGKGGAGGATGGSAGAAGAGGGAACAPAAGGSAGTAGSGGGAAGSGGATCEPDTCGDMMLDGDETDVDCGGSCFKKCVAGAACKKGGDCSQGICTPGMPTGKCATATCTDMVKNGDETDVDCGGTACSKCADTKGCNAASDCKSGVCGNDHKCAVPTCMDGVQNGTESDLDCGGAGCAKCPLGQKCTAATDCATAVCAAGKFCACPDGMVIAPKVNGGQYCVDQTEVTYADYALFWQANPTANEMGVCKYKKNYTPSDKWPAPMGAVRTPVAYVDWCDAAAYCRWHQKHLCGAIGMPGVGADITQPNNASISEWYNACSAGDVNAYPYGTTYDPARCDGKDFIAPINDVRGQTHPYKVQNDQGAPLTPNDCQGGAPLLYDMSGNIAEWEDSCQGATGEQDSCLVRGGSYLSDKTTLTCKSFDVKSRGYSAPDVGFRCCL